MMEVAKELTPEQKQEILQELTNRLKKPARITKQQRNYYRNYSPYLIQDDPYAQRLRLINSNPGQRIGFRRSPIQIDDDNFIIDWPIFY